MAPKDVIWPLSPHTAAKHDMLRRYLAAWFPILLSGYPRLTYAEGFAGPGVYTKGEFGSPVIAVQVLASHSTTIQAQPNKQIHVLLVEEDRDRRDRLAHELARALERVGPLPTNVHIAEPVRGDCADVLPDLLTRTGSWGHPMFVVLDSFGGPDIPYTLLQHVALNPAGEALATFGPEFLSRHGADSRHAASGDKAFGGIHWRGVLDQPSDQKRRFLVDAYRTTMHNAGFTYVLAFEMVTAGGHPLWLMFGTNNVKGVEEMKEAMWGVDPTCGVQYRDPRDPNQMTLDIEETPDVRPLARMLLAAVEERPRTLDELRDFALLETVYRPGQVRGVVINLLRAGQLTRDPPTGQLSGATLLKLPEAHDDRPEQLTLGI